MTKIDFKLIARAALSQIDGLLHTWLPQGKSEGNEYKSINPTRSNDKHVGSFSVNLRTGVWSEFATGDGGSDLISLYAYLFSARNQADAAKAVASACGVPERDYLSDDGVPYTPHTAHSVGVSAPPPKSVPAQVAAGVDKPKSRGNWIAITPVPEFAVGKEPKAHFQRGVPDVKYPYRDVDGRLLGFTCRFTTSDGGKEVLPLTFARHVDTGEQKWTWVQWQEPRPLYLTRSKFTPHKHLPTPETVVVVEGEKCADALADLLNNEKIYLFDVVSWSGGGKAVGKADWAQIKSYKNVILWPDRDNQKVKNGDEFLPDFAADGKAQPGTKAMAQIADVLVGLGVPDVRMVTLPAVGTVLNGYDVADVIDGALSNGDDVAAVVLDWLGDTHQNWCVEPVAATVKPAQNVSRETVSLEGRAFKELQDRFIRTDKGGIRQVRENVFYVLSMLDEWRDLVAFDEFANRIVKTRQTPWGSPAGEWVNRDDLELGLWMSECVGFAGANAQIIMDGVALAANKNRIHPPRDYLNALKWDGMGRLDYWLKDAFAARELSRSDGEYLKVVGEKFMIGAVARIFEPGCKFDSMMVLEGSQGRGKSTAIKVLFGDWFSDTQLDLQNKDAYAQLDGIWGYEIGEMDAFSRAEATRVKGFVTSQVDRYRAAFERRPESHFRSTVFIGTTNQEEYLKDPTGARRFWPVAVSDFVEFDWLRANRDQLWAEAVARYKAGEVWHVTPAQQDELFTPEQQAREVLDGWFEPVAEWCAKNERTYRDGVKLVDVFALALEFPMDKFAATRGEMMRLGSIMRQLGYERKRESSGSGGKRGYVYVKPA